MKAVNTSRIDFKYRESLNSPIISKTIFSNTVSTIILKNILDIKKYVNKKETYAFDILIYTVVINNLSEFTAVNVKFKDNIPKGTKFVLNSLRINDRKKVKLNPKEGFDVGDVKPFHKVIISFKVVVLPKHKIIKNYSTVKYGNICNVGEPPITMSINSNKVETIYKNRVFKELLIENTLKIDTCIDSIEDVQCNIEILKVKPIKILVNDKDKTNNLYLFLIIGKIEYEILYTRIGEKKQKCHLEEETKGFSTLMIAPIAIKWFSQYIKVDNEYTKYSMVSEKKVFISTAMLIYF